MESGKTAIKALRQFQLYPLIAINSSLILSLPPRQRGAAKSRAGFALIISIVLMAFLVVLVVSMTMLTRVETQIAANSKIEAKARANALVALNIALGQLQQHVGPDQRTTARADILDSTNATSNSWTGDRVTGLGGTVYHNNNMLTGVWGNAKKNFLATDNSAYVNTPQLLTWLVSGNETVSYTAGADSADKSADLFVSNFGRIDPATITDPNYTADVEFAPTPSNPAVQLVGPGTVGGRNPDGTVTPTDAQKAMMVAAITQPLTVASSQIPGLANTNTQVPIGRYAYWVGDEGVKAKFNLPDQWAESTDAQEKRYRYQTAQRAGIELMTTNGSNPIGTTAYDQATPTGRDNIAKAITYNSTQVGGTLSQSSAQNRFHDLTTYSYGVMSDTLNGGLKKDLTAAFSGTTLPAELRYSEGNPSKKLWHIPQGAFLRDTYTANMVSPWDNDQYDGLGPDWKVLRSYFRLPIDFTAPDGASVAHTMQGTGSAVAMDPIATASIDPSSGTLAASSTPASTQNTQMGVFPVIAGFKLYTTTQLVFTAPNYHIEIKHVPVIILWNPYNVTLNDSRYLFDISFGAFVAYARLTQGATNTQQYAAINANAQVDSPYFFQRRTGSSGSINRNYPLRFEVASGDIPPGMSYEYSIQNVDIATNDALAASYTPGAIVLERGWATGGANAFGIVAQSNSFAPPPTLINGDPSIAPPDYYLSFYSGTGTNGILPNWYDVINQTSTQYRTIELKMSLPSPGPQLRRIKGNANGNSSVDPKTNSTTANITIGNSLPATTVDGQTSGTTQHLRSTSVTDGNFRQWITMQNPRASISVMSAWDYGQTYRNMSFTERGTSLSTNPLTTFTDYLGTDDYSVNGLTPRTVLYDIPRPNQPIQSLAALQHADIYRSYSSTPSYPYRFSNNSGPAYVIGNSQANLIINLDSPYSFFPWNGRGITKGWANSLPFYADHSYLANRALWDGYYFSTVPSTTAVSLPLSNGRYKYVGENLSSDTTILRDYDKAATRLWVDGGFNINSTSVEAWRSVLASTLNVPVGAQSFTNQAPVPRLTYPAVDNAVMEANGYAELSANTYEGYRALNTTQISALATAMVAQVKARGPFLSLADFVNRGLIDNSNSAADERLGGAMHAALETSGINFGSGGPFGNSYPVSISAQPTNFPGHAAANNGAPTAAGAPGWVTQADLLQVLGPVLSARSDTFVVRVYGEVLNPLLPQGDSKSVQSRAWAEAIVQRTPAYFDQTDSNLTLSDATPPSSVGTTNQRFGRRLKIISFRWLSPSDI
jgi:Tfp pilus assembly protein PilX